MGCYDEVKVHCPLCGLEQFVQSKSGECLLQDFDLETCPEDVLDDVNRHAPFECWAPLYNKDGHWSPGDPVKGCHAVFYVDRELRITTLVEKTEGE